MSGISREAMPNNSFKPTPLRGAAELRTLYGMKEPSEIIAKACGMLASHQEAAAGRLVEEVYPFEAINLL